MPGQPPPTQAECIPVLLPPSPQQGSGFIWDTSGRIVTNFHVVKGASDVQASVPAVLSWGVANAGLHRPGVCIPLPPASNKATHALL